MNIDVNESEVLRAQKGEGSFYIVNKKVGASNVQHCQVHSQIKKRIARTPCKKRSKKRTLEQAFAENIAKGETA